MGLSLDGLVVSDLDGTLLRPDGTISAASAEAVNQLMGVQQAFIARRVGERRMRPVETLRPPGQTLSVTFVEEYACLAALQAGLIEAGIAGLTLRLMDYPDIPGGATLEISRDDVDKVARVAYLAASMGLAPDDVVVFGDHLNDLPMFAWAGTAVAVDNALPEVLSGAALHCESNDDDGVARFLVARLGATRE